MRMGLENTTDFKGKEIFEKQSVLELCQLMGWETR